MYPFSFSPNDLKKADPDFPPRAPHETECCRERMYLEDMCKKLSALEYLSVAREGRMWVIFTML